MYKTIKIGNEEYKLEYSFEASLYGECVDAVMTIITKMSEGDPQKTIEGMSNLPMTAITVFYAGLLEHHGLEGDKRVPNFATAKRLAKEYILSLGENGNFYDLFSMCIDQMGEDGFFKRTGLEAMMSPGEEEDAQELPKVPQDHKRKTRKTTDK